MMSKSREKSFILFSLLLSVCLFLGSPKWLTLQGVTPCWSVLWLLPWALSKGRNFGLFTGLCLGLVFDSLTVSSVSQIPALTTLGYFWGVVGSKNKSIELSLNLGLLACVGTIFFGFSLWVQNCLITGIYSSAWLHSWSFHTLLSQTIITSLVAPLSTSWILLAIRRQKNSKIGHFT